MKRIQLVCLVAIAAITMAGCAAPIKYSFDGKHYRRAQPHQQKAVVDLFQDLRTEDEHNGTFSATERYLYTKDQLFKKNISQQVTNALVKHLEKAKMFDVVAFKDFDDDTFESPVKMDGLKAEGYDIAVQGDLYHFYGYRSGAGYAAFFGVAGILTEALVRHKIVGGRAAYGEVKFIDLATQQVLWQGDLNYDYEDKAVFYGEPPSYAILALRELNNQLTEKLDGVINER